MLVTAMAKKEPGTAAMMANTSNITIYSLFRPAAFKLIFKLFQYTYTRVPSKCIDLGETYHAP